MSQHFSEIIEFRYKRKSVQQHCWFGYTTSVDGGDDVRTGSLALGLRKRIFFGILMSLTLLAINGNSGCIKSVIALDIEDKNDSESYDDYVESFKDSVNSSDLKIYPNQSQARPLEPPDKNVKHNDDDDNQNAERDPSEIQKAVCTITAGEVRASAEAVTTKTLKGVCGSAELQLALGNLEAKILKQIESIKTLLLEQVTSRQQPLTCDTTKNSESGIIRGPPITTPQSVFVIPSKSTVKSEKNSIPQHANKISDEYTATPKLKSLGNAQHETTSRDKEVFKFNNTMLADKDVKIFTYYWRLENFTERIESGESVSLDSPRFAIKGKPLHLKAYFQHLHRDFLFIQLEYATTTMPPKGHASNRSGSGSSNNIILDMGLLGGGSLFKAISSNDQILFKYKISILDQQNLRSSKDLISQEFHNLEGGFLVPNSALLGSPYIKNDTLLVQLFLYL